MVKKEGGDLVEEEEREEESGMKHTKTYAEYMPSKCNLPASCKDICNLVFIGNLFHISIFTYVWHCLKTDGCYKPVNTKSMKSPSYIYLRKFDCCSL